MKDILVGRYVICRTQNAGAFAGILNKRDKNEVYLLNAKRLWYWRGAASLSELASSGTSLPDQCKFPEEVNSILLIGVIELIECSEEAQNSIKGVPVWKA